MGRVVDITYIDYVQGMDNEHINQGDTDMNTQANTLPGSIKKGDIVVINDKWMDEGDDSFTWQAVSDEEKGRINISPIDINLAIKPVYTVCHYMVSKKK